MGERDNESSGDLALEKQKEVFFKKKKACFTEAEFYASAQA